MTNEQCYYYFYTFAGQKKDTKAIVFANEVYKGDFVGVIGNLISNAEYENCKLLCYKEISEAEYWLLRDMIC
jgi:hypothetical protein